MRRLACAALLIVACDVEDDAASTDACVVDDTGNCLSVGGGGGGGGSGGEGGGGGGGAGGGGEPGGGTTAEAPLIEIFWEGMGANVANDEDELTVTIDDGEETHTYLFGMAETGSGDEGWYGEDCLPGEINGKDVCHPVGEEGAVLSSVSRPGSVNDENTLLWKALHDAGKVTYVVVQEDTDDCWAFGHDPTYYTESVLHCATYTSPQ